MFPTHKDCANFMGGFCILYGLSVDPNGAACLRFKAKNTQLMTKPQFGNASSFMRKYENVGIDLSDLKRRLDKIELKIKEIKAMLKD